MMRANISLIVLIVAAISCTLSAEDTVYFADPNLEAAVEAALGIADPNGADMAALTALTAHESGITNLTGLELAANLQNLLLRGNQISDISPLAELTNLEWIELSENPLGDLSALSGLTKLEKLYLNSSSITDLSPLSQLENLKSLFLSRNQVGDLSPISGLTNLQMLSLDGNQLSDVSLLSELTNMDRIWLGNNQISDISPLSNFTKLRSLYLSANNISDISPVSQLKSLQMLDVGHNHITDLSPVAGLPHLSYLNAEHNEIRDMSSLSELTTLTVLNLRDNHISDVSPLSELILLRFLYLSRNNISDISQLTWLLLLRLLDISFTQVSDLSPLSGHVYLEDLYAWSTPLDADAYTTYIPLLESYGTIVKHSALVRLNLITSSTAGGWVAEPGEGSHWYGEHYTVDINAVAAKGYAFTGWSGTAVETGMVAEPSAAGITVTMTADCTLEANFAPGELAVCVDNNIAEGAHEDGRPAHPYDTIQEAINAAEEGEVVLVYPGVYQEEIDFLGKAITVQGVATADGIAVLENTGGIAASFSYGEGPDTILKNIVIRNSAVAIFVAGSSPTITNITFSRNVYGVSAYNQARPDISNCIFWANTGADLYQCQARYSRVDAPGEGNITEDPLFFHVHGGDYHLHSKQGRHWPHNNMWIADKTTSPCINSGDPASKTFDEPVPNGGIINMGAYGGTEYASKSR
ncbi:MAG: leucine-rich repeat domain-containing protein [Planctomycetota bacterium]|jgi:Leucine-rich repeat (LRR) protein